MRLALIILAGLALPAPALADTNFPTYDVAAKCKEASGRGISASDCIDSEQRGYDFAKAKWPELEERFRAGCVRQFGVVIMAYTAIGRCVADSLFAQERSKPRSPRPFRY